MTHFFTPEEANKALPEIKGLFSQIMDVKKKLDRSTGQQRREDMDRLTVLMSRIEEKGVEVKDLDQGLLDFPALRFTEPVYLCWKFGEEEVLYWHGSEGFRGRKPLKPEATKVV
ncbi:MAG: DUF2203 domain-containing protein [Thaumarchaeota archaeon]|nr:DUF2203 domain-containing protein [Nitrososphaerota archaeon]